RDRRHVRRVPDAALPGHGRGLPHHRGRDVDVAAPQAGRRRVGDRGVSTVVGRPERTRGSTEPATLLAGPYGLHRGKSAGWWGMVMVIFTEATFFGILLSSYWYIRFTHGPVWPPDGIKKPDLMLVAGIMTPVLLLSSAPMHWAELGIKKGRIWQLRLGLFLTFLMGATFLSLQVVEYLDKVKEFTPTTDAYG